MSGPAPPSTGFVVGLALLLLFVAFVLVRPYLGATVLAVLMGFLMQPLQRRLVRWVRFPSLAATIGLLLFTIALVLPLFVIVDQLRDEVGLVAAFVQDPTGLAAWIESTGARFGLDRGQTDAFLQRAAQGLAGAVQGALVPTISAAAYLVGALVLFFFLLWFVLRDGAAFLVAVKRLTPLHDHARERLYRLVGERTRAIALGTFLVSIAQGVVAGIGWWIFGFPAPVFWGFVMTIIAVLPLGAPFLVMVPAGIFALLAGDYFSGIGILVWAAAVVGLIDNLLRPYVVGRSSDVHPAIVLVGTIGGLTVFGISGFLLGPLLLSLLGPVLEVWVEERRAAAG